MGPIEILVAAEQMKYDLNNSQFVAEVMYKVVAIMTAENSVGVGSSTVMLCTVAKQPNSSLLFFSLTWGHFHVSTCVIDVS